MSYQRNLYADRERLKAEAQQNRVIRAAQAQKSDEEEPLPASLFGAPKRNTGDDAASQRAKNVLGCFDTVQPSIQQFFPAPAKTSQKSQKPRSLSSEKRRSRSRSNDDTHHSNASTKDSSNHSNRHSDHHINSNAANKSSRHSNTTSNEVTKDSRHDTITKERLLSNGHSNQNNKSDSLASRTTSESNISNHSNRLSNKPNLPNLKIKNEANNKAASAWLTDHPPLENILQEMSAVHPPLTAIHTPRKDDLKFPFLREDSRGSSGSKNRPIGGSTSISTVPSKTTKKLLNLDDSDSDSDLDDQPPHKKEFPRRSPSSHSASRPGSNIKAAHAHLSHQKSHQASAPVSALTSTGGHPEKMLSQLSCSSSEDEDGDDSSSSDSDSDSSSDDDEDDVTQPAHTHKSPPATPKHADSEPSWNIGKILKDLKKTSPGSMGGLDTSTNVDNNPPSNQSTASRAGRDDNDSTGFDDNDSTTINNTLTSTSTKTTSRLGCDDTETTSSRVPKLSDRRHSSSSSISISSSTDRGRDEALPFSRLGRDDSTTTSRPGRDDTETTSSSRAPSFADRRRSSNKNNQARPSRSGRDVDMTDIEMRDDWKSDLLIPPLVSPPRSVPLEKTINLSKKLSQNVSRQPDPDLSSSDMDISDNETETKSHKRRESITSNKSDKREPSKDRKPTNSELSDSKRSSHSTKRTKNDDVTREIILSNPSKKVSPLRHSRGDVTPKRYVKTKAERKFGSVRSDSSDGEIDVEATTPLKQRQNLTQASKLASAVKLNVDSKHSVKRPSSSSRERGHTSSSHERRPSSSSRERKRTKYKRKDSEHSEDVIKSRRVDDLSEISKNSKVQNFDASEELKKCVSDLLIKNVRYIDGRPRVLVTLNLNLIHEIPGKSEPEVEKLVDRQLNERSLSSSGESESESEAELDTKPDTAVPTAVSPIKSPPEGTSLRLDQLPKIPKRKHTESPDSGSAKRYRSHLGALSSNLSNDHYKRSPSPDPALDPYKAAHPSRTTPQWLQEPGISASTLTASNSRDSSSKGFDTGPSNGGTATSGQGFTDFSQYSSKLRDWDTPPQSTDSRDPFRPDDDRQQCANHYLEEAKKLKHHADKLNDVLTKSLTYLESVLCFIQCGNAMEKDALPSAERQDRIFRMYGDTLMLIRKILHGRNDSEIQENGDKFIKLHVLSNRIQSLLRLKLFKLKKPESGKLKKIIDDYSKNQPKPSSTSTQAPSPYASQGWARSTGTPSPISPSPSPASVGSVNSQSSDMAISRLTSGQYTTASSQTSSGTTPTSGGLFSSSSSGMNSSNTISIPQRIHSVTQQYVNTLNHLLQCHELWELAETQAESHKEFFAELDHHCGVLTLHSDILHLVKYVRLGLHRLKDT